MNDYSYQLFDANSNPVSSMTPDDVDYFSEEVTGTPPSSENFLQRAIKSARGGGWATSPLGMVPASGQEALDIPKALISSQSMFRSPLGPIADVAGMVGARTPENMDFVEPETQYGGALKTAGMIAPLALGALEQGPNLVKGAVKMFKEPGIIQGKISDVIDLSKDALYRHKGNVKMGASNVMGKALEAEKGLTKASKVVEAMKEAVVNSGGGAAIGEEGDKLLALANKYASMGDVTLNSSDVQKILAETTNDDTLRKALVDAISKYSGQDMPSLEGLRGEYAKHFEKLDAMKQINSGNLKRLQDPNMIQRLLSKGRPMGPEMKQKMLEMERIYSSKARGPGFSVVDPGAPTPVKDVMELNKQLKSAKLKRNVAGGGLAWLLSRMLPRGVTNAVQQIAQ